MARSKGSEHHFWTPARLCRPGVLAKDVLFHLLPRKRFSVLLERTKYPCMHGNRATMTFKQLRTIERTRDVTNPALVLAQHRCAGEVAGTSHFEKRQMFEKSYGFNAVTTRENLISQHRISPRRSPDTTRLLLAEKSLQITIGKP